jgi:hypothetical protein
VHPLRGREYVEMGNPYDVGMTAELAMPPTVAIATAEGFSLYLAKRS